MDLEIHIFYKSSCYVELFLSNSTNLKLNNNCQVTSCWKISFRFLLRWARCRVWICRWGRTCRLIGVSRGTEWCSYKISYVSVIFCQCIHSQPQAQTDAYSGTRYLTLWSRIDTSRLRHNHLLLTRLCHILCLLRNNYALLKYIRYVGCFKFTNNYNADMVWALSPRVHFYSAIIIRPNLPST